MKPSVVHIAPHVINVLLVDDHPLFRAGLAQTVRSLAEQVRVFEAADVSAGLRVCSSTPCDLIVLDLYLPGLSGLDGLAAFRRMQPDCPVVLISGDPSADLVREAGARGAQGFIHKGASPAEMRAGLRAVIGGEGNFAGAVLCASPPHLSPRQRELLGALVRGWPNKQIAREMGTSENTVRTQLARIFRSLGVKTRTEAAHVAHLHGLI